MHNDKFLIYQRGGFHFFTLSFFPVKKFYLKLIGQDFGQFIFATKKEHLFWMSEKTWISREGGRILGQLINDKKFKKYFVNTWERQVNLCDTYVGKFHKINLKKTSSAELSDQLTNIKKYFEPFSVFTGMTLDFLDEVVFYELKKILSEKIVNNFNEQFAKITTAAEMTYVNKRDLSFWKVVKEAQNDNVVKDIFLKENIKDIAEKLQGEKIFKMILTHLENYWWTRLGWSPQPKETEIDIIKEIRDVLIRKRKANVEIKRISGYQAKVSLEKKGIIKKIKLHNKYFNQTLSLFEELAIYHDQRKEYQVKMLYCAFQILREIAYRDNKLKFNDLLWYSKDEVIEYLKDGKYLNSRDLDSRKRATFYYEDLNKSFIQFGENAEKELKKYTDNTSINKKTKELSGVIAYPGKVTGTVKMSHSSKELIKKMKPGDVLVTSMTLPDFVPAMKKAAAIVTDEGGITCHAAIISRELGIPCIVGTKIATKVLKDGDLVEVDANKGVVRLVKE